MKRPGVLSKVQMLNLVLEVGVFSILPRGSEPRESHHQVQRQGGRGTGKTRKSQCLEWALVQDQSQEPHSRVHGICIGSVSMLSEHSQVASSALDGHHLEVPIACRPSDVKKCEPALMHSRVCLKRGGVGDTNCHKKKTDFLSAAKFCTPPTREQFITQSLYAPRFCLEVRRTIA